MAHYIDKDALVAEIENLLDKGKYHEEYDCAYRDGNNGALYALKGKLDTLEAKEVDLELTWEDMFDIFSLVNEVLDDYAEGKTKKEVGEEILKRFKAQKGK